MRLRKNRAKARSAHAHEQRRASGSVHERGRRPPPEGRGSGGGVNRLQDAIGRFGQATDASEASIGAARTCLSHLAAEASQRQ